MVFTDKVKELIKTLAKSDENIEDEENIKMDPELLKTLNKLKAEEEIVKAGIVNSDVPKKKNNKFKENLDTMTNTLKANTQSKSRKEPLDYERDKS